MRRVNGNDKFYSRSFSSHPDENFDNAAFEAFLDKHKRPTTNYPHVHVREYENGTVVIVASRARNNHVWRIELQNPDGNEVNDAVDEAITYL